MKKPLSLLAAGVFSLSAVTSLTYANTSVIENADITNLRFYDKPGGKTHGLIILNNERLLAINPDDNTTPCQLWTSSETVFDSARLALTKGMKVDVTFVARGDEGKSCQVNNIAVKN